MIANKKVVHIPDLRAEKAYADRDPWNCPLIVRTNRYHYSSSGPGHRCRTVTAGKRAAEAALPLLSDIDQGLGRVEFRQVSMAAGTKR